MLWEEVGVGCGGEIHLTESDGDYDIKSPNFPSNPPQNVECEWVIMAQPGKSMRIDFMDTFHIKSSSK